MPALVITECLCTCRKSNIYEIYNILITGTLGIIDYDTVDYSNLHRQLLYKGSSVGMPKVEAARHELSSSNRHIDIVCYNIQLNSQNCLEIIKKYDVVLDATDNVATRYLLNDACVIAGKPLVSGSALQVKILVSNIL